jgi:hypothetical protein
MEEWATIEMVKNTTTAVTKWRDHYFPVLSPIQQYMFVEDGNQLLIYKGNTPLLSLLEPERYDFIIRNDYCLDKKSKWINNKIIYRTLRDCGEYKPAAVSLLSFVVYYQNIMVDVQLQTEEYNYMITGNVIDKTFIYYLLKIY